MTEEEACFSHLMTGESPARDFWSWRPQRLWAAHIYTKYLLSSLTLKTAKNPAEAALKTGNAGSAAGGAAYYMNLLRKNRIENYVDVATVTLDDILMERRLELFTEGHTAWDYWRNGKSVNNKYAGVIDANDNQTVLPIPQTEIEVSAGKLIQNTGY